MTMSSEIASDRKADRSPPASRRLLTEILAPHRRALLGAAALTVAATGGALAVPFLVKLGIDRGIVPGDTTFLAVAAVLVVVVAGIGAVLQWGAERLAGAVAEQAVCDLRLRLGRHLQSLSFEVFDRQQSGRLLSAGTNDVDAVYQLLSSASLAVIPSVLYMIGVAVVLALLDWVLALVVLLVVLPVLYATTVGFRGRSTQAYRRVREASARVVGQVAETLGGIRVVQAFGREAARQADFDDINGEHRAAKVYAARFSTGYGPFTLALGNVALFLVLIVGGFRAIDGAITVGTIAAFILYLR
ncbi:MAG: ABC transporter transmembrane domain-containing protein, partial [Actinomycetota bacterium]|nr:ABC transporter transmembrane domain-containing protein [Actinomycetota bacterium]